jgi:hypothetical protein
LQEEDVESAIEAERNSDIYSDDNVLYLYKQLRLQSRGYESIIEKRKKVQVALVKILKRAGRFKKERFKIYTIEEIEMIFKNQGVYINGAVLVKKGFKDISRKFDYTFMPISLDAGKTTKYNLYKDK